MAAIKRTGSRSIGRDRQEHIPKYISCLPAAEMVQATPFLLVILLALGAHGISTEKCIMTGCCVNDLGSNMTILNVTEKGDFNGTYYTAVSGTTKKIEESPLLGSQQLTNPLNQPTFGFTVHWNFTDSISVFTGQCFMEETQKEVLRTMWLLRLHADKRGDNWNATMIGHNRFERLKEQKEE